MLLQHYVTLSHHSNSFCIKEADKLNYVTLTLKKVTLRRKYGRLFRSYTTKSGIWNCWSFLFLEIFYRFCTTKRSKEKLFMMKKTETQRCVETENSASEVMTCFRVNEYISATSSPWIDVRVSGAKVLGATV
jgi:hypothetical protein